MQEDSLSQIKRILILINKETVKLTTSVSFQFSKVFKILKKVLNTINQKSKKIQAAQEFPAKGKKPKGTSKSIHELFKRTKDELYDFKLVHVTGTNTNKLVDADFLIQNAFNINEDEYGGLNYNKLLQCWDVAIK